MDNFFDFFFGSWSSDRQPDGSSGAIRTEPALDEDRRAARSRVAGGRRAGLNPVPAGLEKFGADPISETDARGVRKAISVFKIRENIFGSNRFLNNETS